MDKIIVDKNLCIGCTLCTTINNTDPDFELIETDMGLKSRPINKQNYDLSKIKEAIEFCPVNAISLSKKCNCNCNCKKSGEFNSD